MKEKGEPIRNCLLNEREENGHQFAYLIVLRRGEHDIKPDRLIILNRT